MRLAFSPDGSTLLISGEDTGLWLLQDRTLRPVDARAVGLPAWSPHGDQFAAVLFRPEWPSARLALFSRGGRLSRYLSLPGSAMSAAWSPDALELAVDVENVTGAQPDENPQLLIAPLGKPQASRVLTRKRALIRYVDGAWIASGKQILFNRLPPVGTGQAGVRLMSVAVTGTSGPRQVSQYPVMPVYVHDTRIAGIVRPGVKDAFALVLLDTGSSSEKVISRDVSAAAWLSRRELVVLHRDNTLSVLGLESGSERTVARVPHQAVIWVLEQKRQVVWLSEDKRSIQSLQVDTGERRRVFPIP